MSLIEILLKHLNLKDECKYDFIHQCCPSDFDIFSNYIQGEKEWCPIGTCSACWNSEPIENLIGDENEKFN